MNFNCIYHIGSCSQKSKKLKLLLQKLLLTRSVQKVPELYLFKKKILRLQIICQGSFQSTLLSNRPSRLSKLVGLFWARWSFAGPLWRLRFGFSVITIVSVEDFFNFTAKRCSFIEFNFPESRFRPTPKTFRKTAVDRKLRTIMTSGLKQVNQELIANTKHSGRYKKNL